MQDIQSGIVIKSTGSWYTVWLDSGMRQECRIKGQLRIKGLNLKNTNPFAVGDRVDVELEPTEGIGIISKLHDRRNYIIRRSTNLSKQTHIIASNIDRAYVMATLVEPRTSTGFIDRFLITAEAYSIPATIIFNKRDLLDEEYQDYVKQLMALYESLGYSCHFISSTNVSDVAKIATEMQGKINLVSGHSGVGKSTLINALEPQLDIRTGELSQAHNKGMHTTTFAEMHPLKNGGWVIDTPGIKEFGIIDLEKNELSHFFPEMRERFGQCKFHNCVHDNEPGCAVRKAVENGEIAETRYTCYLAVMNGEELDKAYD
jgi:ribosome biogenesis GTPase / thiamine phosphate phosphatase